MSNEVQGQRDLGTQTQAEIINAIISHDERTSQELMTTFVVLSRL